MTVPVWHYDYPGWWNKWQPGVIRGFDLRNNCKQKAPGTSPEERALALAIMLAWMQDTSIPKYDLVEEGDALNIMRLYSGVTNMDPHDTDDQMHTVKKIICGHAVEEIRSDGCRIGRQGGDIVAMYIGWGTPDGTRLTVLYVPQEVHGEEESASLGTYDNFVTQWQPVSYGECLSKYKPGLVEAYLDLADGSAIVAEYSPEGCDAEEYTDDPQRIAAHNRFLEDGDVYTITHYGKPKRHLSADIGEEIDSLSCLVGYGGAEKALVSYAEHQMGWEQNFDGLYVPTGWAPPEKKASIKITQAYAEPEEAEPEPEAPHALTAQEKDAVRWMVQDVGWYKNQADAVKHVLRLRARGGASTLGDVDIMVVLRAEGPPRGYMGFGAPSYFGRRR